MKDTHSQLSKASTSSILEVPGVPDLREELSYCDVGHFSKIALTVADALRDAVVRELAVGLSAELKNDRTVVTLADIRGEEAVRAKVAELLPDAGVLGEEQGHTNPEADFQFVTDPVDGTLDLTHGLPTWGCVLALYYRGHHACPVERWR